MSSLPIYNQAGEKVGTARLSSEVFGMEPKVGLIHQVVVAMQANLRRAIAHTKTRGEVRGGGKKPWRQKGTGRARAGSIRSPLWRGGGIIFGPRKERNFSKRINKKVGRKALLMVLSDKVKNKKIVVLEEIKLTKIKTQEFKKIINQLPVKNKKIIFFYQKKESPIVRAANNIANLKTSSIESLNILDLLKYEYLLITKETLKELENRFKIKNKK